MQDFINTIQNSSLGSIAKNASSGVLNAIGQASAKTGVDFAYLVQQAKAESNFDADVKASTSSATGLFQFISSTWMNMVEQHGEKYGINTSEMSREEILELRKDPEIASNMAAEFASENERFLEAHWAKGEKEIGSTELYFAHFMGAGGAASFLNARDENPLQSAAVLFPKAAAANRNVFYEQGTGRAKSLDEVYHFFDKKFDVKSMDAPIQMASSSVSSGTSSNKGAVFNSNFSRGLPSYQLTQSPVEIMLLSQLELPSVDGFTSNSADDKDNKNSLFYGG